MAFDPDQFGHLMALDNMIAQLWFGVLSPMPNAREACATAREAALEQAYGTIALSDPDSPQGAVCRALIQHLERLWQLVDDMLAQSGHKTPPS